MLDKARFLEVAPTYYALAIVAYLRERPSTTSRVQISKEYSVWDDAIGESWDQKNDSLCLLV
jgi:hypothetical protein